MKPLIKGKKKNRINPGCGSIWIGSLKFQMIKNSHSNLLFISALTAFFALVFLLTGNQSAGASESYHQVTWEEFVVDGAHEHGEPVETGDMNNDGNLDIITASDEIVWYEAPNNPRGNWKKHELGGSTGNFFQVKDFDGDDDLDIIALIRDDNTICWYENGNSWEKYVIDSNFYSPRFLYVADIDEDGNQDVVAGNNPDSNNADICWWKAPVNPKQDWSTNQRHYVKKNGLDGVREIKVADVDHDGNPDVVANDAYDGKVLWFESPNDPTLIWTEHRIGYGNSPRGLDLGDLDEDGDIDVVIADRDDDEINWFEAPLVPTNDGWTSHTIDSYLDGAYDCTISDIDGDGDLDVVATGLNSDVVNWYESPKYPSSSDWKKHNIQYIDKPECVSVEDIDKDGNPDVISTLGATSEDNGLHCYFSSKVISYIDFADKFDAGDIENNIDVDTGDVDNDGDLDLLTTVKPSNKIQIWENDNTPWNGNWNSIIVGTPSDDCRDIDFGDVDGDGNLDILSGDYTGRVTIWENNGDPWHNGWNSNVIGTQNGRAMEVEFTDLDGDGDQDICSGDFHEYSSYDNNVYIWENDGSPWNNQWDKRIIGNVNTGIDGLISCDLDNDGDFDLVTGDGEKGSSESSSVYLWENDGTPWNSDWNNQLVGTSVAAIEEVKQADFDNDGFKDIASVDHNGDVTLWKNDGTPFSGNWNNIIIYSFHEMCHYLVIGDLDNDGDEDIIVAVHIDNEPQLFILSNSGSPFQKKWIEYIPGKSEDRITTVQIADLDNDGDLDAIIGGQSSQLELWENRLLHRNMPFEDSSIHAGSGNNYDSICSADLDNDGDEDIISGDDLNNMVLFENTRPGFTSHKAGTLTSLMISFAADDVDHDGDSDIFSMESDGNIHLWENPGSSLAFTSDWDSYSLDENNAKSFQPADINSDGKIDVVEGLVNGSLYLLKNDGTPFIDSWSKNYLGKISYEITDLNMEDLNNDGYIDIITTDKQGDLRAWENDGTPSIGEWSNSLVDNIGVEIIDCVTKDLDNDAYPDLMVGCKNGDVVLYENDGTPFENFWEHREIAHLGSVNDIIAEDFNLDGETDLMIADGGYNIHILDASGDPFEDHWNSDVISFSHEIKSLAALNIDLDGDTDVAAASSDVLLLKNTGGTIGFTVTDSSPPLISDSQLKDIFKIEISHDGLPIDEDIRIIDWKFSLYDGNGDLFTSDLLRSSIDEVRVYSDNGNGDFEPGVDSIIHSISDYDYWDKKLTLHFPDNNSFKLSPGEEETYFVSIVTTGNITDIEETNFYMEFDPEVDSININQETNIPVRITDCEKITTGDIRIKGNDVVSRPVSINPNPALVDQNVNFIGEASTVEGEVILFVWKSDIDGEIYNGSSNSFTKGNLSLGTHNISLRVQNSIGNWSEWRNASLVVHDYPAAFIENINPSPAEPKEPIRFSGKGEDDGSITAYHWRTEDYELYKGTSGNFTSHGFSVGIYTIYFSVKDNHNVWSEEVSTDLVVKYFSDYHPSLNPSPISITTKSQSKPDIHNKKVVWQDKRDGRWDIFLFDLGKPTDLKKLSNTSAEMGDILELHSQEKPLVNEKFVVWLHDYYYEGNIYEVFLYEFEKPVKGGSSIFQLDEKPDRMWLAENHILWSEMRPDVSILDIDKNLYSMKSYNINTGKTKELFNFSGEAGVDSTEIAYFSVPDDGNKSISETTLRLYSLTNNTIYSNITIPTATSNVVNPALSGSNIVWQDLRNDDDGFSLFVEDNYDIYLLNTSSMRVGQLTSNTSKQYNPDIHNNTIIFQDSRDGYSAVYGYSISNDKIALLSTNDSNCKNAAIHNERVVWECNDQIYLYHLYGAQWNSSNATFYKLSSGDKTGSSANINYYSLSNLILLIPLIAFLIGAVSVLGLSRHTRVKSKKKSAGIILMAVGIIITAAVIPWFLNDAEDYDQWANDDNREPNDSIWVGAYVDRYEMTLGGEICVTYIRGSELPITSSEKIGEEGDYVIIEVVIDELGIPILKSTPKELVIHVPTTGLILIGMVVGLVGCRKTKAEKLMDNRWPTAGTGARPGVQNQPGSGGSTGQSSIQQKPQGNIPPPPNSLQSPGPKVGVQEGRMNSSKGFPAPNMNPPVGGRAPGLGNNSPQNQAPPNYAPKNQFQPHGHPSGTPQQSKEYSAPGKQAGFQPQGKKGVTPPPDSMSPSGGKVIKKTTVSNKWKCQRCGQMVDIRFSFCLNCGAKKNV